MAREPHRAPLATVVSAILEDDILVGHFQDAVIGQWPAVQRMPEVAEHRLGTVLRLLDVNLPHRVESRLGQLEVLDRGIHHGA